MLENLLLKMIESLILNMLINQFDELMSLFIIKKSVSLNRNTFEADIARITASSLSRRAGAAAVAAVGGLLLLLALD